MTKVRHVLGISGGKDSAALAIYMKQKYPTLEVEYYNSDTGCELEETEKLVDNLESFLGKVERLKAAEGSPESTPFDHFLKISGGYLPSPQARWCTQKMKLAEFEKFIAYMESVRLRYVESKDKADWYDLIQLLPSSYNQMRTVTLNYEVLTNSYYARRGHKLDEWHTLCDIILSLPYAKQLIGACGKEEL
jgi:hypothetical protein